MSRFTLFSLLVIVVGLLLLGFQSLQSLMGTEFVWKEITLEGLLRPEHVQWFESISWSLLQRGVLYVLKAPFYAVLLCVGGVLLILSGILGRD